MNRHILALLLLFFASTLLVSCTHKSPQPAAQSVAPQKHWVQDHQMKALMAKISTIHSTLPNGLPEDVESPEGREAAVAAGVIATDASELARTADELPGFLEGKNLSEADRRGFIAQAQTLHDQAIVMRDAAEKFRVETMQRTVDEITSTCIACHSRYRDLTGNVDIAKSLITNNAPTSTKSKP